MSEPPFTPVPVKPRHDGWTPEKQWQFVEEFGQSASIVRAARLVGMTVRSAQRLRDHPQATEFRAAWDGALQQAWGQLERSALDRALNGEVETVDHDGRFVAERRRPCSDRLLIHLLNARERALAAARADRAEAHERAMAAAKIEAIRASVENAGRKRTELAAPAPLPQLANDAAAETASLQDFRNTVDRFTDWPSMDEYDTDVAGNITSRVESVMAQYRLANEPECPTLENRLRWEDFKK